MIRFLFCVLVSLVCLLAPASLGGDIAELLRDGSFWEKPLTEIKELADVLSSRPQDLTFRTSGKLGLRISTLSVGETLIAADERETPVAMTVMVYNKGDDGEVPKEEFDRYVASATSVLNELTGVKGKPRKISKKDSGVKLSAWQWVWESGAARLETASAGTGKVFQPEFVRLKFAAETEGLERGGAADVIGRSSLKKNVRVEGSRHWIDGIAMVDQGQKGYCVPATLSRLFAYYGMDGVDQHALAALCDSRGAGGTSTLQMEAALKKISSAFHIRLTKMDGPSLISVPVKDYNKVAKRQKKAPYPGLEEEMVGLDPDVLMEVQAGKSVQVQKWLNTVARSIDAGVPIVWSVMLGLFPEDVGQSSGGHMRMIIGYDMEKKEILYSDSWGSGHELKSMPAAQAITITMFRYILRPTR